MRLVAPALMIDQKEEMQLLQLLEREEGEQGRRISIVEIFYLERVDCGAL